MRPILRRLHSPDVNDLKSYHPEIGDDFRVLVQAMIGPADAGGEESFDFTVERDENVEQPKWEGTRLFVNRFEYSTVLHEVEKVCASAEGDNWQELAAQLGQRLRWEFEGYRQ